MRPTRLELTAFGPFAGTEVVDFGALADAGLFLVTGPTGAGKTTLLDAVSYALYGRVPGARRPERLRSDHAPPELDTEVALEFSHAGNDWRVTRKPPHERARRRGDGTAQQKPTATLARRAGDGWEPVCAGVEEVGGVVAGTLGLDAEQFAQVIVLPQGEVSRALRADARERERLLSSLFATERFAALTERLAERARDLGEAVARHTDRLDGLRSEAAVRWREVAKEVDLDDLDEPPATQEALDDLVAQAAAAAEVVASATATAQRGAASADVALRDGERLAALHERRDRARDSLAALDAHASAVVEATARVERARAAAPLRTLLAQADRCAAALETAVRDLDALAAEPVADLVAVRAQRARVEAVAPRAAAAAHARAQARAALDEALRSQAAAEQHVAAAAACRERIMAVEEGLAAARAAAAALADLDAVAARLRAAVKAAQRVPLLEQAWQVAREAALAAAERSVAAESERNDRYRRSLEGMAGRLARDLVAGEACAVCGAADHPRPAVWADPVTDTELAEADTRAARLRAEAEQLRQARDDALRALEVARAAAGEVEPDEADQAHASASAARTRAAEADDLAAELAGLRDQAAEQQAAADEAAAQARDAGARATAATAAAGADDRAVAEVLGDGVDPAALAAELAAAEARLVAVAEAEQACNRATGDAERAAAALAEATTAAGFADPSGARAALLDEAGVTALAQLVDEHRAARRHAVATLAEPEFAALDEEAAPDLAALELQAEQARHAADTAVERQATVTRAAAELRGLARSCARELDTLEPLQADAARVRHLAEVCRGPGNARRMSLERFVLAAALEDVTARASVRLAAMTDGRYTLRHSDDRERGNRASGLSIVVCDAFTGTERDVGTLSGGETFQASLALALGLADAVSGRGALPLDTLFVDEGFGSLDAEALEQALTELDRLREGGRLVGVISHVATLRERIPVGLHVTRTRTGSHVELV